MSAAAPVDLMQLSRELLPRRITFKKAAKLDIVERPRNVVNLNPGRSLRLEEGTRGNGAAADEGGAAAGDFGVRPPGHDEEDPLYAVPEAVLQPMQQSVSVVWPAVSAAGGGLANYGNTCFMNSVLQALAYTPPLATYLKGVKPLERSPTFDALGTLAMCVSMIHKTPQRSSYSPKAMVANLRSLLSHRHFRPGQQADAHEFAIRLLEACNNNLVKRLAHGRKLTALAEHTTPLMRVVGGFLCSQVRWKKADEIRSLRKQRASREKLEAVEQQDPSSSFFVSSTYEPSCVVHLPVCGATLDDCMRRFCATEEIEGYKTPRDAVVTVQRGTLLHRLPKTLIVHMKRFNNMMQKVGRHVAFAEEWDVAKYMTAQARKAGQCTRYRLASVVVHHGGGLSFGHYTAYVRAANNLWYDADDSRVSQVNVNQVLQCRAYMLCYVQVEDLRTKRQPAALRAVGIKPGPHDHIASEDEDGDADDDDARFGAVVSDASASRKPGSSPQARPAPQPTVEGQQSSSSSDEDDDESSMASSSASATVQRSSASQQQQPRRSPERVGRSLVKLNEAARNVSPRHSAVLLTADAMPPALPTAQDDAVAAQDSDSETAQVNVSARKMSASAANPALDSDEAPITDDDDDRTSERVSGKLDAKRLSYVEDDGTLPKAAAATLRRQTHAARGLILKRKMHRKLEEAADAGAAPDSSARQDVAEQLRAQGDAGVSVLRKKAHQGTFAKAQRDAEYDAQLDHASVKKTKAERRAAAIASGKLNPQAVDGRNQFQEVANVRRRVGERQEEWMGNNAADDADAAKQSHGGRSGGGRGSFGKTRGRSGSRGRDEGGQRYQARHRTERPGWKR